MVLLPENRYLTDAAIKKEEYPVNENQTHRDRHF